MDLIVYLLILSVGIIYWFQLTIYNNSNNEHDKNNRNIIKIYFNKIKIPIIVLCLLIIVTELCVMKKNDNISNDIEVFTSIANF